MERAQLSFANKVPPKKKRKSRTAFTNHQVTFTHTEITKITDKKLKTTVRGGLAFLLLELDSKLLLSDSVWASVDNRKKGEGLFWRVSYV
jgi:hypothetical protein